MKRVFNVEIIIDVDPYVNLYQDDYDSQKDLIEIGLNHSASLLKDKWGHDMSHLFSFEIK